MCVNYKLYKKAWIYAGNPKQEAELTTSERSALLKKGGWIVRNCYEFDSIDDGSFWYVIKSNFGDMEELSSKVRNQVRRAQKTLRIELIDKSVLLTHGFSIHKAALQNYRVAPTTPPNEEDFKQRLMNHDATYQYWGCFDRENDLLVAFSINKIECGYCNYETFKALPNYLVGYYPFYGLLYEMNKYYLQDMQLDFVSDGARSITNHSEIQPFLIGKFKFRKAYCKMHLEYVWWLKCIVVLLYPFRKWITQPQIRTVLDQDAMCKGVL